LHQDVPFFFLKTVDGNFSNSSSVSAVYITINKKSLIIKALRFAGSLLLHKIYVKSMLGYDKRELIHLVINNH